MVDRPFNEFFDGEIVAAIHIVRLLSVRVPKWDPGEEMDVKSSMFVVLAQRHGVLWRNYR
jgi:hypothetical protein